MDRDAQVRIDDLENRLDRYHSWLTEAIEERDRLALDAAWGVHYAHNLFAAQAVIVAITLLVFSPLPWWGWLLLAFASTPVQIGIHMWSNGQRMKEVDRFAKLPEWEWKRG